MPPSQRKEAPVEGRYVGIDLGVRSQHRAAVFDGTRQRGKGFSFAASKEGFDKLLSRATEGVDGPVHFVFEPTGLSWVPLSAYLSRRGHRLYMVKPQKASDLRKFLRKHTKSDQIDAASLARLPQIDPTGVNEMSIPTPSQMTLRRLVRRRDRMSRRVGRQKRRLHALLTMVNPFLVSALGSCPFGVAALKFLTRYADPDKVLRLGKSRLSRFWVRHSRNNAPRERVEKVYEACQKTAELYRDIRRCGQLPFDYEAIQEELVDEVRWLEQAQADADRLEKKIIELHEQLDPHRTLQKLHGVGPVIAAGIDATVGDVERFRNSRCFVSFTGLCPRKSQSGQSDPSMPITKAGQRLLKMYLYLAAERARHLDPDFAAYYAKRYARGDHHNRIMVALARKMALRVYALLKRRARAQTHGELAQVSYVLRARDGRELQPDEARALIQSRYSRTVVAAERDQRDRARKARDGGARACK
jgi:transposase